MRRLSALFVLFIALLISAGTAMAATRSWTGSAGSDWDNASNWNTGEPLPADNANIRWGGNTRAVEMTTANTIQDLLMGGNNGAGSEPSLTLKTGSALTAQDDVQLGYSLVGDSTDASASLIIEDGTHIFSDLLNIAIAAGASNTNGAQGSITINGGSLIVSNTLRIATGAGPSQTNTTGSLIVNGGTFQNTASATIYVGDDGDGTMTVNGGTIICTNASSIKLATGTDSTGTLKLLDGSIDANNMTTGIGTASIVLKEGFLTLNNNKNSFLSSLATAGTITAVGGMVDDSAMTSVYTTGAGSLAYGDHTIKWGYDSVSNKTALWAQSDAEPYFETTLNISFSDANWTDGATPQSTTISIDGTGAISSSYSGIVATVTGDPLPASLYNQSFTYTFEGHKRVDEATGLGSASVGLFVNTIHSLAPGQFIQNDRADTPPVTAIVNEFDLSTLTSGYKFALKQIETHWQDAGEIATFIDLVNPANRTEFDGTAAANDTHNVSGMNVSVESADPVTQFLSLTASTNNPSSQYRLQSLQFQITPTTFVEAPLTIDALTVDRLTTTPNDRLRVNYELGGLDEANGTVHLAVLDAADTKLEFTAYDDRSANTVRGIYTTKTVATPAVTNAASDFTVSGFFSSMTNDPFAISIPVDDSLDGSDEIDLTDLSNPASVWKAGSEQVVYIDLPSIAEIAGTSTTNVLTVQVIASNDGGSSNVVGEIDVTIIPDGSVTISKISSEVTDPAAFAATQSIIIGSGDGNTGNRFTGQADKRHPLTSAGSTLDQTGYNYDSFGMFFDTDVTGEFTLTDILITMHNNGTTEVPAGTGLLKLELWKVNTNLTALSMTDQTATFPNKELIFTGTGNLTATGIADNDIYKLDLPEDIELDADTRYGWFVRWNTTAPAVAYLNVDLLSYTGGNHLRSFRNGEFPFYGTADGTGAGEWDIVFGLNGFGGITYESWATVNGLSGDDAQRTADPDEDGMDNLVEYALGGDPLVADAGDLQGTGSASEGGTNYFEYVYNRRLDAVARGLTYTLTDRDNLMFGNWATNTTAEVGSGAINAEFEAVTNRWATDINPVQFIELQIQED